MLIQSFYLFWKRSKVPTNPDVLISGDYYESNSENVPTTLRVKHPLAELDKLILQNLLRFISTLHAVWLPDVKAGISEEWQVIYYPEKNLKNICLVEINYPHQEAADWKSRAEVHFRINYLFIYLYGVVEEIVHHENFFSEDNLLDKLKLIFAHVDHLDFEKKGLFVENVIQPILLCCPPRLYGDVLPLAFGSAFNIFASIAPKLTQTGYTENSNRTLEVINDYFIRMTLRRYVLMVDKILFEQKKPTERMIFFISNQSIVPIIRSLIFSLCFVDDKMMKTLGPSLILCMSILQQTSTIPKEVVDLLFHDIVMNCKSALLSNTENNIHVEVMTAVVRMTPNVICSILHQVSGVDQNCIKDLFQSVSKTPENTKSCIVKLVSQLPRDNLEISCLSHQFWSCSV
eukprot:TRINITY_DN4618_c0_g1_i6.p1 TRINITY_DN4618_c0_g1~~TRINITY_DN4618_c0_g1_i6.p1  ORF type:complete len:402 (-),score=81.27 TRINITY_DN4618_c0_g1_i6:291-1496(-)